MSGIHWPAGALDLLRVLYPHQRTADLEDIFNRSSSAIYEKARQLGLRKSPEFLAGPLSGRLDGKRSVNTRFQPGQRPWNKGMKGLQIGGEATRFKKGNMPFNTADVGDYRVTKDGTLQRKIGQDKGSNSMRWRSVHELIWIAANGPVAAGHICVFMPGMKTNKLDEITIDRVECISFAENMRRNSYHRYPKEIARLIQLRGALIRKTNHQEKIREQRNDR